MSSSERTRSGRRAAKAAARTAPVLCATTTLPGGTSGTSRSRCSSTSYRASTGHGERPKPSRSGAVAR